MNSKTKHILLLLLAAVLMTTPAYGKKVKNIIFLIGDGMGLTQMYAGMTKNGGHLNLEQCQYVGLSKTYSADSYITDSAAGGTALACGVKTNNGMLGMTPDSAAVKSILHIAEENGKATGIVVACSVTHATPAAFVAHQPSRSMDKEIAEDYLKTDIDVFIGGGRKFFEKKKRNLTSELKEKNYQVVTEMSDLQNIHSGKVAGL
ncbi:MAG: alkaline phosphatase, partial [Prevotellaceae bacterium]|nr:alkaline phosphatase [Prevotellaceae bacterium]